MVNLRKLFFGTTPNSRPQRDMTKPDEPLQDHEHVFGPYGCWCGAKTPVEVLEQRARRQAEEWAQSLVQKHRDLIDKFLVIAERKVSTLDEYGDEQLHLLQREMDICIGKIAIQEGIPEPAIDVALFSRLRSELSKLFYEYHIQQKDQFASKSEIGALSGVEFETHVARVLRLAGFEVTGTPMSRDQGADLIASKGTRRIIIQAKRYNQPVGNDAVQEVVAAIRYYDGTEGIVVTNSTFTPSARALAQKNDVKLIDGAALGQLHSI